jgi:hypothetical protein
VSRGRRIALEAGIAAALGFVISLIVFGPLLSRMDVGWSGGDMLSTYVNSVNWGGFSYTVTTQFGFPLGMNLNYFPGIDITENMFALVVNAIAGTTFLGINLLIVVSFPLVAALAYLVIRLTGLQGPLAIALAVAFTFIPFHWGRALGHTYLSTLYSAVIGLALVLIVGSGLFERLVRTGSRRRRVGFIVAVVVMVVTVAWTGVYYVAFTLILGAAALLWRFAQRARWQSIALEAVPFAGIGFFAALGFIPALLTLRADPPLASLGERLPYESVVFAGNLAMALMPLPQSELPGMGFYNRSVVEAFAAAPYGESTVITNHGTWITALALLVFLGALLLRTRRGLVVPPPKPKPSPPVTLGFISYLIVVVLLFFIPWGLNYLLAGTVTAQIRAWNRLLPVLLLLFLLGAAAALHRSRIARRLVYSVPIAVAVLALVAVDSVLPFKQAYAASVNEAGEATQAARAYAGKVNSAVPLNCGVLQLPYMAYPEFGLMRAMNDYDHFWTSITNDAKQWSYGSVKYTDASIWAAQLPQVPTDAQVDLLRQAGFCAIHLDTRGYVTEQLAPIRADLAERFGAPVATGFKDQWEFYVIGEGAPSPPEQWSPEVDAFFHQPLITIDPLTVMERESEMESSWWWTKEPRATFTLTPTRAENPLQTVSGAIGAPPCATRPATVTLTAGNQTQSATVIAKPGETAPFTLTLPSPSADQATLVIDAPGEGCAVNGPKDLRYAQVVDLTAR